jgi:hypothetical protein
MLQPKQEERATAKELKALIKKCNIFDDTTKENKIYTNSENNFFKNKKYE